MVKKLRENDFFMKALSLVIAIGMWLFVAFNESPDIEIWFYGVSVEYQGDDALSEQSLVRLKDNEVNTVSVKVRGSRSELLALSSHDIKATVDLSGISSSKTVSLPINIKFPSQGPETADRDPAAVSVTVDDIVQAEKNVSVLLEGEFPEGVSKESMSSSLNTVTVTGPSSVLKTVRDCVAVLDVSKISSDKTTPVRLDLRFADGSIAAHDDVSFSNTHTTVSLAVAKTKTLPVKANITNSEDIEPEKITITPAEVSVTGPSSVINSLSEIQTHPFSISEEQLKTKVYLDLPENMKASPETVDVEITLKQ